MDINMNILDGNNLKGPELKQKLEELFQKEKFVNLVKEMQNENQFNVEDLVAKKAYIFDLMTESQKNRSVETSTIILLVDVNEKTSIFFNELSFGDHFHGEVINNGNHIKYYYDLESGELVSKKEKTDGEKLEFIDEEFPENSSYKPLSTNEISQEAWWSSDGCLPGNYQHCGGNCGYGSTYGGGPAINSTDICCIAHDRCWSVFGSGDKCCDKELVNCVSGHTTWAASGIRTYFGPRALLC